MIGSLTAALVATPIFIVKPPTVLNEMEHDEDAATWQILVENAEMAEAGTALKKGDHILRQRLVPKKLAVVSGDIERDDGKDRWAKAGDQLFGAKVGEYDAYCVLRTKINLTAGMFLVPTKKRMLKQDCFIDSDNDGKLDQRFEADPGIGVLPNVARSEPRAFYDLKPVSFSEIEPAQFDDESWVQLEYRGGGGKKNKPPELRIRYRYGGTTKKMSNKYLGAEDFPSKTYLLGSEIEFDKLADGKLSAKVIKPMDSGFGVTTRMVYF